MVMRKPLPAEYVAKIYDAAKTAVSDTAARRKWGESAFGSPVATIELCAEIARLNRERLGLIARVRDSKEPK